MKLISLLIFISSVLSFTVYGASEKNLKERGVLVSSAREPVYALKDGMITWLVEEGKRVKKGDLIAEIAIENLNDTIELKIASQKDLQEDLKVQEEFRAITLKNAINAQELLKMQIAVAQEKMTKLKEGATPEERRKAVIQWKLALLELDKAKEDVLRQESLVKKGFAAESSLESLHVRMKSRELGVLNKKKYIKELERPPRPEELTELQSEIAKLEGEHKRAEGRLALELKNITLAMDQLKLSFEKGEADLLFMQNEVKGSKMLAPTDGIARLVKKRDRSRNWGFYPINVGIGGRDRDVLAEIIDPSQVEVHLNIHEVDVNKVKKDIVVEMTIPALNNTMVKGMISYKSALGKDLKDLYDIGEIDEAHGQSYFKVIVDVIDADPRFQPGMSALVQIPTSSNSGKRKKCTCTSAGKGRTGYGSSKKKKKATKQLPVDKSQSSIKSANND
ncbi:MAG: hypothetical protein HQL32_03800 [Planctomycetes bacterium]|nr:hypothetical protein [Planctomycetota bacterium]